ncbi:MAG: dienelactone hydrolase family protein, partial [Rhizomicrobium sp.]
MATIFTAQAFADSTTIKIGASANMNATLITPDGPGPYPAILVLHTSGGLEPADLAFANRLAGEGYVALVPEFLAAYGISPQTRRASFTTYAEPIYGDFVAALQQLRTTPKVDGKRLGAVGFSNGGYFALWLAATNQIQAGVAYYGAVTGGGTDPGLDRFRQAFTARSAPVLILHGTNDGTVPFDRAAALDSFLTSIGAPHEFHSYDGADHRFDRTYGGANSA